MRAYVHDHDRSVGQRPEVVRPPAPHTPVAVSVGGLLGLQRAAGNRAVVAALTAANSSVVHDVVRSVGEPPRGGLRAGGARCGKVIHHNRSEVVAREGPSMLAHELSHVAAQTGQTVHADEASTLSLGVPGAGVVQRMMIGDFDTDVPGQLSTLLGTISAMTTLRDVLNMRTVVIRQLRGKDPDDNVQRILKRLDTVENRLPAESTASAKEGATGRPGRGDTTEASRGERSTFAAVGGRRDDRFEAGGRRERATETTLPGRTGGVTTRARTTDQSLSVEENRRRPRPTASAKEGPTGRPHESDDRTEPSPEEKAAKFAEITEKGQDLKTFASALLPKGGLPVSGEDWLAEYNSYNFEQLATEWEKLARPYRTFVNSERDFIKEVRGAISDVERGKARYIVTGQKDREKEKQAQLANEGLVVRKQEIRTQEEVIGRYVQLNITAGRATEELLRWLFGAAMSRLLEHRDSLATDLLERLAILRAAKGNQGGGPRVYLRGSEGDYGVRGDAEAGALRLTLGIRKMSENETKMLLASDSEEAQKERGNLVNLLAKGLIHEGAHVWQIETYRNVSHPWTRKHSGTKPVPVDLLDQVPMYNAPTDVQNAFSELEGGGKGGGAKNDPDWQSAFKAMTHPEYYQPGRNEEMPQRDMRARELVSHLMEIVYAWNSPGRFKEIFPECSRLLDRVVSKGADVRT